MKCPVCSEPAKDISEPSFDGQSIRCASCGDYDIAGEYIEKLTPLSLEERLNTLSKARKFTDLGARCCISGTSF